MHILACFVQIWQLGYAYSGWLGISDKWSKFYASRMIGLWDFSWNVNSYCNRVSKANNCFPARYNCAPVLLSEGHFFCNAIHCKCKVISVKYKTNRSKLLKQANLTRWDVIKRPIEIWSVSTPGLFKTPSNMKYSPKILCIFWAARCVWGCTRRLLAGNWQNLRTQNDKGLEF